MKSFNFPYSVVVILLIVGTLSTAQCKDAICINLGWYKPSMDYWNNSSPVANWDSKFDGSVEVRIGFEFSVLENFRGRLGFGYWGESVEQAEFNEDDELKSKGGVSVSVMPLMCYALYYRESFIGYRFDSYLGLGAGLEFVQVKPANILGGDTREGSVGVIELIAGTSYPLASDVSVGVELGYTFARYTQQFINPFGNIDSEIVSLAGPKVHVVLFFY